MDPLSGVRAYADAARMARARQPEVAEAAPDFGRMVGQAVEEASQATRTAEQMSLSAAAGRADIVDVVTAVAAAETSLETVIAVRDQVINAYQEILRMPI